MTDIRKNDPWGEINGGLRGSTLLGGGAILTFPAALQNLAYEALPLMGYPVGGWLVTTAWLTWIAALFLLAAGFMWVGIQPFFSRFGWVVGAFHGLNALFLLAVLFAAFKPPVPGVSLAIGRTVLLLFFAMVERSEMRSRNVNALLVAALLQFLKIGLRLMGWWPELDPVIDTALDAGVLCLLAGVMILVAGDIHRAENHWAREMAGQRASGFADFNNPEHDWNQEEQ